MQTVDAEATIDLPIERAFALLADHARYDRFPGVTASELLAEGEPAPNGLGAKRRISLGDVVLDEEITAYDPPRRLDYRIYASRPVRVDHEGGSIVLTETGEGTHIRWTSRLAVRLPVIGPFVTRRAVQQFERGFRAVLEALPDHDRGGR